MPVLNGGTLLAELRYLGSYAAAIALFFVPIALATFVGRAAHLSSAVSTLLVIALWCAVGAASVSLWWRNRRFFEPTVAARYAPVIIPLAVLGAEAYWILTSIPPLQWRSWKEESAGSFVTLCVSAGIFGFYTLRDWRTRYLHEAPPPVPQFTQQRFDQFSNALALEDAAARRRAVRPLLTRGYIRIALLITEAVLMIALVPRIGIAASLAGSLLFVGGVFLVGRKFFDL